MKKKFIGLLAVLLFSSCCIAQVTWEFSAIKKKKNVFIVSLKATIADGWRLFSQDAPFDKPAHAKTTILVFDNPAFPEGAFISGQSDMNSIPSGRMIPGVFPRSRTPTATRLSPHFDEVGKSHEKVYKDDKRDLYYTGEVIFKKKVRMKRKYKETVLSGFIEATVARVSTGKYIDPSTEDLYTDKQNFNITIKK